jgi:hypothetical protein
MGFADEIVPEPLGGAHSDPKAMAATLKVALLRNLKEVQMLSDDHRLAGRYDKFRVMGRFSDGPPPPAPKGRKPKTAAEKAVPEFRATDTLADKPISEVVKE